MKSSPDPPKNPEADEHDDDQSDRKPPPDGGFMTDEDRISALKSHNIRYEDAIDPKAERVTTVQPHDVILGRGKRLADWQGNVRMRRIAQKYSTPNYHALKASEKKSLIENVYQEVVQDGARFLIKGPASDDEDSYLLVDEEIALQKLGNIVRRRKPIVEKIFAGARIEEDTNLDPKMHQAMSPGRSLAAGHRGRSHDPRTTIHQGITSTNQQMALGDQVARLPTNPILPPLTSLASLPTNPLLSGSLASLPYTPMYHHPSLLARNPTEQMRIAMMARMIEQDRMVRDAIRESRASALYAQALNRNAFHPLLASAAAPLVHMKGQSHPNSKDEGDDIQDKKSHDEE